jgi:hypothetical protein
MYNYEKNPFKEAMQMKEPLVSRILKYALYAAFAAGLAFTISMPFMFETYVYIIQGHTSINPDYRAFIVPFLMAIALPCLWIMLEMIWMLRSIPKNPFIMRNVRALGRTGLLLLLLSLAFIGKTIFFPTFLTLFCILLFIAGGLFAFTLAALIRQSIAFREENDLTI